MNSWNGEERRKLSDLSQVMERLSSIDVSLGMMTIKFENLHNKINSQNTDLKTELDRHRETLYGNGKPGLTHYVTRINELDDKISAHVVGDRWFYGIIITLIGWVILKLYLIR